VAAGWAPAAGSPAPRAEAAAAAAQAAAPVSAAEQASEAGLHVIKSPIVGTFYSAPGPDAPPFVSPGARVEAGQVLCIVEAMKLMNEIESDASGEIVKCLVVNGQPIEYGQPLFAIRPS
jgi:acetyl-CoA carboxylase biotin carboxyl carrier protein